MLTLVPFIIGAGGAAATSATPGAALGGLLCLLAVMGVFLSRQPVTLWLRITRGRGRRSQLPAARFWSLALLAAAGLAGLGLLSLGRWPVMWLALPAVGVLLLTGATQLTGSWAPSTIGVVGGLALTARAAYIGGGPHRRAGLGVGAPPRITSSASCTCGCASMSGTTAQPHRWRPGWSTAHIVCLIAAVGAALAGWLHADRPARHGAAAARGVSSTVRRPLVEDVKRLGFAEMGMGLAIAAIVILAFALSRWPCYGGRATSVKRLPSPGPGLSARRGRRAAASPPG